MANPSATDPSRRILGLETEYALAVLGSDMLERELAVDMFFHEALQSLTHLPCCSSSGIWLCNGARFYIDCGAHPEFCTPETEHPAEAVRYTLAGDSLLSGLLEGLRKKGVAGPGWFLFKGNVDYGGAFSTWACHESYSHRAPPSSLPDQIIPHLVSRIIYTGAGGLNPLFPGIQFCFSPRVCHLRTVITESSTTCRGIYDLKNEPLAGRGLNRLHVLCGDSVFSHQAAFLKMGATALVLSLAEAGLAPGRDVRLQDPLAAIHSFNSDPTGQTLAPLVNGKKYRALDLQRHYLAQAQAHLEHPIMPPWAKDLCRLWQTTLAQLEKGPPALMRSLDWAIKLALYSDHARARGFAPETFPEWNQRIAPAFRLRPIEPDQEDIMYQMLASISRRRHERPARPRPAAAWSPWEKRRQLNPLEREFLKLRDELCEIDVRFSQLGPHGLFQAMDQAGQLNHHLPEITPASIEYALDHPPPTGRARLRGLFVRENARRPGCTCDWQSLQRPDRGVQRIDDPFVGEPGAPTPSALPHPPRPCPQPGGTSWFERLQTAYDQGLYEQAYSLLLSMNIVHRQLDPGAQQQFHWWLARIQSRRGFSQAALQALQTWAQSQSGSFAVLVEFIRASRFQGLLPPPEPTRQRIRQAEDWLAQNPAPEPAALFAFRCHKGFFLGHTGQLREAHSLLSQALADRSSNSAHPRLRARTLADLADLSRQLGEYAQASHCLAQANHLYLENRFHADFAEFNLITNAKLDRERDLRRAQWLVRTANSSLQNSQHLMGLARALLLEARLADDGQNESRHLRLLQLKDQRPDLQNCPHLRKILAHWNSWTQGAGIEDETDFFWRL